MIMVTLTTTDMPTQEVEDAATLTEAAAVRKITLQRSEKRWEKSFTKIGMKMTKKFPSMIFLILIFYSFLIGSENLILKMKESYWLVDQNIG